MLDAQVALLLLVPTLDRSWGNGKVGIAQPWGECRIYRAQRQSLVKARKAEIGFYPTQRYELSVPVIQPSYI
jgi:hypothetical protein